MRRSCHKSGMYVLCLCCFYSNLKASSPLTFISYVASAQLRARSRCSSLHHLCQCSYENMRLHRSLSGFSQNTDISAPTHILFCTCTHSFFFLLSKPIDVTLIFHLREITLQLIKIHFSTIHYFILYLCYNPCCMTNLESLLRNRYIILLTRVCIVIA